MGVHRIIIARVMRGRRMADADATSEQDWHPESPTAHVLHLGDLIDNLAHGIEDEIGEHEIDDGARTGHGGATPESDKTALADRCVAEPDGAVQVIKPGRRLEVAAAYADPFAQNEDRWIACHLFSQTVECRLHVGDFARCGFRRCAARRRNRSRLCFREDELGRGRRVGPGARFREPECVGDDRVDL